MKLRPARREEARTLVEQRTPPPSLRLSDPPEDLEISFVDTCPRPFRGFTICTTGVDRVRRELVRSRVHSHLTSTLLAVNNISQSWGDGRKYYRSLYRLCHPSHSRGTRRGKILGTPFR